MTTAVTPTMPAHNRWVLQVLATDTGRRILPGLCGLRYVGRRTGRTVTLPVAYAACGTDVMVLVARAATKRWWHNFRGGHPARLLIDGRWRAAQGEVVGPDRIEYPRLLAGYRAAHPHTSARTTAPVVHFVLTDRPWKETEMNDVTQALIRAADVARRAPSIHNTQPWRLVVAGSVLDVRAEPSRQLTELDPDGHMMLISCGTALHHAVTALEADGWRTEIERVAGTTGPVARIRVTGRRDPDPAAVRRLAAVAHRRTDRRPVPPEPVPAEALAAVTRAVSDAGLRVHVLRPDQVVDLAVAVDRAVRAESGDDRQRAELAGWAGGTRPDGTGVPGTAIPGAAPQTTVPGRDFGVTGTLPPGAGHDEHAVYAVVFGAGDTSIDWLRAGEALSAAWLDAVDRGLTLLPFSAPAEIASTRLLVQRLVSHVGYPYLVVRLGVAAVDAVPGTPRLPARETLEVPS